jgi:hypothetical protein
VAVFGVPRPGPEHLGELLGRCAQLRNWALARGLELDGSPDDLELLDHAIDEVITESGGHSPMVAAENEAGLYLGTVITARIPGAHWRLWPNGHPVVCLATGRDLDVVAIASDRVSQGAPLLARVYADAAAADLRLPALLRTTRGACTSRRFRGSAISHHPVRKRPDDETLAAADRAALPQSMRHVQTLPAGARIVAAALVVTRAAMAV